MKFPNPIFTCELSLGLYPAPRRRRANAVPRRATRAPPPPANDGVFFAWLREPTSGSREGAGAALGGEIRSREETVRQPDGELGTSRGRLRGDAHHPRAANHGFRGTQPVLPWQNSHLRFAAAKTHPRPTTGYRNATPSRADTNPSLLAQVEGGVMGVSRIAKHPHIPKGLFPNPCKGKPKA